MPRSLIALGSNLGDRQTTLREAIELLADHASVSALAASGWHETSAVGGPDQQNDYLNAAVACETTLAPEQLHALLRQIEIELGRQPGPRWGPRAIDLDLLLFDEQIIVTPDLLVPHPRMAFRRFVLEPSAEVARKMVHPVTNRTIGQLLAHLDTAVDYVAFCGPEESLRTALAQRVARAVGGRFLTLFTPSAKAARADDPSGLSFELSIQFFDRAADLLAAEQWPSAPSWAVSDFYFDEPLAWFGSDQHKAGSELLHAEWRARRIRIVEPKLLVLLDDPEQGLFAAAKPARLPPAYEAEDRVRHALLKLATSHNRGPVLFAGRNDSEQQFAEIAAALAAMA